MGRTFTSQWCWHSTFLCIKCDQIFVLSQLTRVLNVVVINIWMVEWWPEMYLVDRTRYNDFWHVDHQNRNSSSSRPSGHLHQIWRNFLDAFSIQVTIQVPSSYNFPFLWVLAASVDKKRYKHHHLLSKDLDITYNWFGSNWERKWEQKTKKAKNVMQQ